ncbi:MAG: zf-TFIIB domain-containing protein [Marinicellaceae bacterium]
MKCPVCKSVNLLMSDKKGVEIDYCSECRGVWLDRGELDKIIERSHEFSSNRNTEPKRQASEQSINHTQHQEVYTKKNKKTSRKSRMGDLLGDIFDF